MRRWNDDPFTKKARSENYEARSIYKLEEIDKKEKILQGASVVVDLGAAPGSWTQYCLKKIPRSGKLVAIDLSEISIRDPRLIFIQESIETVDLAAHLDQKADVVLSDMAPKTTGVHTTDVARSIDLATMALETAKRFLKPGGGFVVKVFMGEGFEEYRAELRKFFTSVSLLKPESTRKQSREIFFIGKGFKG